MNERMLLLGVGAGLVLVIAAAWAAQRAAGAVGRVAGTTLNPASADNLAYGGVSGVGRVVSGNPDWSLGTWLWEIANADKVAAERAVVGTPPFNGGGGGGGATGGW